MIELSLFAIYLQIFTQGCIPKLQGYFEQNLYTVGGIALGVALAQLLGEFIYVQMIIIKVPIFLKALFF